MNSTVTQMELARQTLEPGYLLKTRNMAISAAMVLPEPVGAPSRTLVSVWYSVWKICVWIGLKWVNLYRLSYSRLPRAVTGSGCRSNNSERERIMEEDEAGSFNMTSFMAAKVGHIKRKTQNVWQEHSLRVYTCRLKCCCFFYCHWKIKTVIFIQMTRLKMKRILV